METLRTRVRRVRQGVKRTIAFHRRPWLDAADNRRFNGNEPGILLMRHRTHYPDCYGDMMDWLEQEDQLDLRRRLRLGAIPSANPNWSKCRLLVPWLSDTFMLLRPKLLQQYKMFEARCAARGIGIINRSDTWPRASKLQLARSLEPIGVYSPRTVLVEDPQRIDQYLDGFRFPLLARDGTSHGGVGLMLRVEDHQQLREVPWHQMRQPLLTEFIDVADHQGHKRKYRFLFTGDQGFAHSMMVSHHWEVRSCHRIRNDDTVQEELDFQRRGEPNQDALMQAARTLGLDYGAFDYSFTRDGQLVIWEVNVMPSLELTLTTKPHLRPIMFRAIASVLKLYFQRAGFPVPSRLEDLAHGELVDLPFRTAA